MMEQANKGFYDNEITIYSYEDLVNLQNIYLNIKVVPCEEKGKKLSYNTILCDLFIWCAKWILDIVAFCLVGIIMSMFFGIIICLFFVIIISFTIYKIVALLTSK
jgi:hypothetical protein